MPILGITPVNLGRTFWEARLAEVGRQVPGLFGAPIRWRDQDQNSVFPRCLAAEASVFLGPASSQGICSSYDICLGARK